MRKIEDWMPTPERRVAFSLEPDEAPDLPDRGQPGGMFRPHLVRIKLEGDPSRLVAVHVSGPRLTSTGRLHAVQTGWWGWTGAGGEWPPADAPACAIEAIREVTHA